MSEQLIELVKILSGLAGTAFFLLIIWFVWRWIKKRRWSIVVVVERAS